MKKPVICKACGYIMEEGKLRDQCPACGVPKTAFIPFEDKMSPKRRKILNLHIHKVMVHFPQAISVLMLFLMLISYTFRGRWAGSFMFTAQIISLFLPFSVLAGLVSGLIDGKTRFKRLDTQVLIRKIIVGSLFFLFSLAVMIIQNFSELTSVLYIVSVVLTAFCVVFSIYLGLNGGRLSGLEIPG